MSRCVMAEPPSERERTTDILVYYHHGKKAVVVRRIPKDAKAESYIPVSAWDPASKPDPYWHVVPGYWELRDELD